MLETLKQSKTNIYKTIFKGRILSAMLRTYTVNDELEQEFLRKFMYDMLKATEPMFVPNKDGAMGRAVSDAVDELAAEGYITKGRNKKGNRVYQLVARESLALAV